MSYPRTMRAHVRALSFVVTVIATTSCGGAAPTERQGDGGIDVSVASLFTGPIEKMVVDVSPANVTQDLGWDMHTDMYIASLILPVGIQQITVSAYAGGKVVGVGKASVSVTANATSTAFIHVLDITGPDLTQPDHGPIVGSFVLSKTTVMVGEVAQASVTAADVDGDALTYLWQGAACDSGAKVTIATPSASSTTWSADGPGHCGVMVTVTANNLKASMSLPVTVVGPGATGTVSVTGVFNSHPRIETFTIEGRCLVSRTSGNASCWRTVTAATMYTVSISLPLLPDPTKRPDLTFTDTCGGTWSRYIGDDTGPNWGIHWTPASSGPCLVTASSTVDGLSDTFSVAVWVL